MKFLLVLILLFVFLSPRLFDVRSRWHCNDPWHHKIQLVDRLCNDCLKLKHLFLLSLHLVDNLVKNVDELGSEHHVRTHINEPPCYISVRTSTERDVEGRGEIMHYKDPRFCPCFLQEMQTLFSEIRLSKSGKNDLNQY